MRRLESKTLRGFILAFSARRAAPEGSRHRIDMRDSRFGPRGDPSPGGAGSGAPEADRTGQGVHVDERLRLVDGDGSPVPGLYDVVPLLKARFREAVAVPELRVHARAVARDILVAVEPKAADLPGQGARWGRRDSTRRAVHRRREETPRRANPRI